MTGAMYAAIAGLKAHMSALNVIGNNIANVNTYAYKQSRYTFDEALYTTSRNGSNGSTVLGGRNPAQIGYGCSVGTIDLDVSTKNYAPTGYGLDCMINGDGFFLIGDKNTTVVEPTNAQGLTLSRLGNLKFDNEGYLTDGNGNVIMGFNCVGYTETPTEGDTPITEYQYNAALTAIRLPMVKKTNLVTTNNNATTVADNDTVALKNTTKGEEWTVFYPEAADGTEIEKPNDGTTVTGNSGNVWSAGALEYHTTAEGYEVPELDSISIDENTGRITGFTTDDNLVVIGYLALGRVDNPNGVTHVDGRLFKAMDGAGDLSICSIGGALKYVPATTTTPGQDADVHSRVTIGSAGETTIVDGGLETSGTDLATEISNMIFMQRGYQANTRIVTVTDSMLEELVNMKR